MSSVYKKLPQISEENKTGRYSLWLGLLLEIITSWYNISNFIVEPDAEKLKSEFIESLDVLFW